MTPNSLGQTPNSRGMRTAKPKKRPEMMPSLIACPYVLEGTESGPPCGHTAKCHGHCSRYSNLRDASHYPCFHYECASLETATPDKLNAQGAADALLFPKYRAQVTPDPFPADRPLTADPPRCPDCLDHHTINMCGVLNLLHSDPDDPGCGSEADESMGPESLRIQTSMVLPM